MRAAHTVTILSIVETVLSSVHFTSETGMILCNIVNLFFICPMTLHESELLLTFESIQLLAGLAATSLL